MAKEVKRTTTDEFCRMYGNDIPRFEEDYRESESEFSLFLIPWEGTELYAARFGFSDAISVGSSPVNEIVIPSPKVSKVHAAFKSEKGMCVEKFPVIEDRGSKEGTYIMRPGDKWERLEPRVPENIFDRYQFRFGDMVFTYRDALGMSFFIRSYIQMKDSQKDGNGQAKG